MLGLLVGQGKCVNWQAQAASRVCLWELFTRSRQELGVDSLDNLSEGPLIAGLLHLRSAVQRQLLLVFDGRQINSGQLLLEGVSDELTR